MTVSEQAKRYMERLDANTSAMLSDCITFDVFRASQRRLWDEIQQQPKVEADVLSLIRARLP